MKFKRIMAAVGTLAVAAGVGITGTTAFADNGNIDPSKPVSFTVHKFNGLQSDKGFNDGHELTPEEAKEAIGDATALANIPFDFTEITEHNGIKYDIQDPNTWKDIKDINGIDVTEDNGYKFGTSEKLVTDDNGIAKTKAAKQGIYLVTEKKSDTQEVNALAAPFVVTLPLANKTTGEWLYDVHAYPKNIVDENNVPTKEAGDPSAHVIDKDGKTTMFWTIGAPVAKIQPQESYTEFTVTDKLDASLKYVSAELEYNGKALVESEDYTISDADNVVIINFTEKGLALFKPGQDNGKVTVKLTTAILHATADGKVKNVADITTNGHHKSTPDNDDATSTNWGNLQIKKVDEGKNVLAGAVFSIYETADASGTPIAEGLTTGKDGLVTSPDLWVGNDKVIAKTYYVKETQAPAGYAIDETVRPVEVKMGTDNTVTVEIANVKQGHPDLPLTGASGLIAMSIIGGVLILGGGTIVAVRRMKLAK